MTTGAVLTDGCGRIGCGLADLIADKIRKTSVKYQKIGLLSAVQIRIGGSKGMLIVDKALAHDDMSVYVRRSMVKILNNDTSTLEIVNWVDDIAHQPYANLNNEVIPLLEDAALRAGVAREAIDQRYFKIQEKNVLQFIADFVGSDSANEDVVSMPDRMREFRQDCTCVLGHAPHAELAQHLRDLRAQRPNDNKWGPLDTPAANDPAELFAVADGLAEVADNFVKKPRYSLGPGSGFLYIVPDPTTTLKAGECFIRHNEQTIEGEVNLWRVPSYLGSD